MTKDSSKSKSGQDRPQLFRALGKSDPPKTIQVGGGEYKHIRTIKHDSWAATALYAPTPPTVSANIICKFNRVQPIGLISMKWLGIRLAHREFQMYHLLRDLPGIAPAYRDVFDGDEKLPNACAHEFIEGDPLCWHNANDELFDKLDSCLAEVHKRHVSYVDMNKAENVIVNTDGDPCLIDFQISVRWPNPLLRIPLRILQRSDLYHSFKLRRYCRPDLVDENSKSRIPWWIRAHRSFAVPFRTVRRRLLVALGIRKGKGMSQSESFVEEALRHSISEEQLAEKPILQLYQLLGSESYFGRFRSRQEYLNKMVVDLFDGDELHADDRKYITKIREVHDHRQIVDLLKSKSFRSISNNWNQDWIEQKIQTIQKSLSTLTTQSHEANPQVNAA